MNRTNQQTIPLTIISGFLGAGKTTLLNHILQADHGLRVAVLVNDFGEINIDSQLVVGVSGEETINLDNGCICCNIRGDLLQALLDLVDHYNAPEYIIIEASGVSDPAAIAHTLLMPQLAPFIRLDSIVAIVDSEQFTELYEQNWYLAWQQVAAADVVILNKLDRVDETRRLKLRQLIQGRLAANTRILETTYAQAPLELMIGVGRYALERLVEQTPMEVHVHAQSSSNGADHAHGPHHDHTLVFDSWSFTTPEPISYKALQTAINNLPAVVFRVKGILNLDRAPERPGILQVVGKRAQIGLGDNWHGQLPHSQIVMIGAAGALDPKLLQNQFEACLAKNVSFWTHPLETTIEWVRDWWKP